MKTPELMAPAGDWASLSAAIASGADAIYFGVKEFNMRAGAKNFDSYELEKVVQKCHEASVKAYMTLNIIIYDDELGQLKELILRAKQAGVDAIIAWDLAVLAECQAQGIKIILSTQASVSNYESLKSFKKSFPNIFQVVLARELSLEQISSIIKKISMDDLDVNVEVFIHGAMCVSVSGRCYTSQFLFGKSANRGECIQPCRREYTVTDVERQYSLNVDNGFVMSAKDMCTIDFVDKIVDTGVRSLKIEGRNKSPEYVRIVVECYREAIDKHLQGKLTFDLKEQFKRRLDSVYNRGFSTGFYLGVPDNQDFAKQYGSAATKKKKIVGTVVNYFKNVGVAEVQIEDKPISIGDELVIIGPTTGVVEFIVESIQVNNKDIQSGVKGMHVGIKAQHVRKNDRVYKLVENVAD